MLLEFYGTAKILIGEVLEHVASLNFKHMIEEVLVMIGLGKNNLNMFWSSIAPSASTMNALLYLMVSISKQNVHMKNPQTQNEQSHVPAHTCSWPSLLVAKDEVNP
jgi:hypothetical protein